MDKESAKPVLYEEERKQEIVDYVLKHGRASVAQLAELFQVSESTVRRDLKDLEDAKRLRRTHGGAVPMQDDNAEPPFLEKEDRFRSQKAAIAKKAAELIEEGDRIVLDSGTTTYHLAKELKRFRQLTVVTNSLVVAQELGGHPTIELILVGGTLRPETLAMVGPLAERAFERIHAHKAFVATNGIHPEAGLTTPNLLEAAVKERMIRSASRVVLLADHSKYGRVSFAKVADLSTVDQCIIDEGATEECLHQLEKAGIETIVAREGGSKYD